MRRVIITGDDFGLAVPVNEAIEVAHRNGILTTTSLMVGADGTEDAVERARRFPSLKVGLHLVLVEGRPLLPVDQVPDLVDDHGELSCRFTRSGLSFFFQPGIRKQLEAEIEAQFQEYEKTGLPLDHVNSHTHMHLHPTVFGLLLKVGRKYGLNAVRLPKEPPIRSWRASRQGFRQRLWTWLFLFPWIGLMKCRMRLADIHSNDFVFGLHDSGCMDTDLLIRILGHLPDGVTEIYFHPATRRCPEIDRTMHDYRHEDEFRALTSNSIKEALRLSGIQRIAFSDL